MAVAQAEAANGYLSDEAYRKALAVLDEIDTAEPDPAPRDTAVEAGAFTGPLRMKAKREPEETRSAFPKNSFGTWIPHLRPDGRGAAHQGNLAA